MSKSKKSKGIRRVVKAPEPEGFSKVLSFNMEKETPNTIRFKEETAEGEPAVVGTLYVQKWAFVGHGIPDRLMLTIEAE